MSEVMVWSKDGKAWAVIDDESLPVTNMIGADGEECDDLDDALAVVAGPDADGMWVTIELMPGKSTGAN